jgi:uncharacterized protein YhdP
VTSRDFTAVASKMMNWSSPLEHVSGMDVKYDLPWASSPQTPQLATVSGGKSTGTDAYSTGL